MDHCTRFYIMTGVQILKWFRAQDAHILAFSPGHSYLSLVTYPPAPTTFEEVIQLIPPRGAINKHRFILGERPFELQIGRTSMNVVWMAFCVPDPRWEFWPNVRSVESMTTQRAVWAYWQQFLEDPEMYLTWKFIGRPIVYPNCR